MTKNKFNGGKFPKLLHCFATIFRQLKVKKTFYCSLLSYFSLNQRKNPQFCCFAQNSIKLTEKPQFCFLTQNSVNVTKNLEFVESFLSHIIGFCCKGIFWQMFFTNDFISRKKVNIENEISSLQYSLFSKSYRNYHCNLVTYYPISVIKYDYNVAKLHPIDQLKYYRDQVYLTNREEISVTLNRNILTFRFEAVVPSEMFENLTIEDAFDIVDNENVTEDLANSLVEIIEDILDDAILVVNEKVAVDLQVLGSIDKLNETVVNVRLAIPIGSGVSNSLSNLITTKINKHGNIGKWLAKGFKSKSKISLIFFNWAQCGKMKYQLSLKKYFVKSIL